ncbi:45828_t:CDS:1, partial [Gigaspora margarita]
SEDERKQLMNQYETINGGFSYMLQEWECLKGCNGTSASLYYYKFNRLKLEKTGYPSELFPALRSIDIEQLQGGYMDFKL